MWNCRAKPYLPGGTVMLSHQNGIICSLYRRFVTHQPQSLLPTGRWKHTGKPGGVQRQYLEDNSSQTNPTRSSALPAHVDEWAITCPKTAEKDLHSHTALKHLPESNATSRQQWIDLSKSSTLISCLVNLCNRGGSSSYTETRMPTSRMR